MANSIRTPIPRMDDPPISAAVIGLAEATGQRLADAITAKLGISCASMQDALPPIYSNLWVLTMPPWVDRIRPHVAADHLAVLWGDRPPTSAAQAWQAEGITLVTGALPSAAIDWLASMHLASEPTLTWEEEPSENADAALTWEEPSTPIVLTRPTRPTALPGRPGSAQHPTRGYHLAVYSSAGGVGKTTTAVYLATLASQRQIATGVVELDENSGGLLAYWDKDARMGGIDSVKPGHWSDAGQLAEALARIAVPVSPRLTALCMTGTAEGLQYHPEHHAEELGHLYAWAAQQWGLTIYDLAHTVRDWTAYDTLQIADRVLFVLEPTAHRLQSAMVYLNLLEHMGDEGRAMIAKMGLVVNKIEKSRAARIDPAVLAESLGLPLWGQITSRPEVYMAGVNHHKVALTPEWTALWEALALPIGRRESPSAPSDRPLWKRLLSSPKKEVRYR